MNLLLILGIFFFLIITFIVINYDKPVKKLDLSRYIDAPTPNHTRFKEIKIKGQSQKYSEINNLKLIPETYYFSKNQWTIMFWITVLVPNKMILVEKGCPLIIFDPPYLKFVFNTPSGKFETMDNYIKPSTTLSHFVWIQDNMTIRIFENSKPYLISDPNQNFTQRLSNTDLKINAHIGNVSFRNFRIFNTSQSYNQILHIYKTEKPIITGEKYIKKKLIKEDLHKAIKNGEIYSPSTKLKNLTDIRSENSPHF
jgi:hypothetical protein